MRVDRWVDLAEDFGEPAVPADLRERVEQHVTRLQAEAGAATQRSPRWRSAGRWVAVGVGAVVVIGVLALAAHTRRDSPASLTAGPVHASVTLLAQQGRFSGSGVVGWRTKGHARVTCGAHPAVNSSAGNNGVRPSDLCRALAYYPAHSTESRCSYGSMMGPITPSRVLIRGTINGQAVHLNMGMHCNPPDELARMTGLIWVTVFGEGEAVRAAISESTFTKLTEIAQRQAQLLGDPSVHSAQVVLTTRRRMNSGLGIGYQASQDQSAKVFVIQLIGDFTCNTCSFPAGVQAPTGSAAQDVLSYGSLSATDFGLTKKPVVMQRMGPIMRLSWKPEPQPQILLHRMVGKGAPRQVAAALGTSNRVTSARFGRYGKDRAVLVGVRAHGVQATTEADWSATVIATVVMHDCNQARRGNCPTLFSELAPNGSRTSAGRLTLSHATFPPTLPGIGDQVARRVAAVGLRATSIEVDDVGVVIVIVHAVADDPAKAVRTKAEERSVAIPGLAATLVEISDSRGNLVSISGMSNLGQFGMAWTAPKYRALVPNQMSGTSAQPVS